MFKRIRRFFRWRKNVQMVLGEVLCHSRHITHVDGELHKIYQATDLIRKNYDAMSFNVVELRNMMARITADFSLMTLELAMKPSVGEQTFVKVNVGVDAATFQAVD